MSLQELRPRRKTVVVIGGGIFGVSSANNLYRTLDPRFYEVKLVTISDHVYFLPASDRLAITKDYRNVMIPIREVLDKYIPVIKGEVVHFDQKRVLFRSGFYQNFDVLIIATGAKWASPIGSTINFKDNHHNFFEKEGKNLKNAKHVVFIGGGFFSTELAGEVVHYYGRDIRTGKKKVTIIHSSDKLLPNNGFFTDNLRDKITNYLTSRGVTILKNCRGTQLPFDPNVIILNDNPETKLVADLVYSGVGTNPSVPPNEIPDLCDRSGYIRVKPNFQAEAISKGNIFAIGDVTDFSYHGIAKRDNWVNTLTHNVRQYLKYGNKYPLLHAQTFKMGDTIPCSVSLGPIQGFGQIELPLIGKAINLPSFIVIQTKSKKLLTNKARHYYSR
ncbi:Apoptosis-inducing factor B [Wickerhamomyces ciferrii]|uniref:Apoptosis-inducing factor B n=1 Tax=Wickerhamomyces ciferrii (strain ATCC 14091 / BCRC 22168 / CBS 111 / JCM 3599 / NBRC 0793 / NRRL Y-1031 F-60-10) TaxID=1206466 RepID=K0KDH8_WICCF|nr:Apoptosis-inducing factor B [Wickerhamomyces ciferrii]CCH40981.1 Apoptosis-inducing factor B [Wickerhamomyces ciferrii]